MAAKFAVATDTATDALTTRRTTQPAPRVTLRKLNAARARHKTARDAWHRSTHKTRDIFMPYRAAAREVNLLEAAWKEQRVRDNVARNVPLVASFGRDNIVRVAGLDVGTWTRSEPQSGLGAVYIFHPIDGGPEDSNPRLHSLDSAAISAYQNMAARILVQPQNDG